MLYSLQNTVRASMLLCLALVISLPSAFAQSSLTYQKPPKEIADLVLAPSTPIASFSRTGEFMLLLERSGNPSIEDLAQPELRIAGMRINPRIYVSAIRKVLDSSRKTKKGIPSVEKVGHWSICDV